MNSSPGGFVSEPAEELDEAHIWNEGFRKGYQAAREQAEEELNKLRGLIEAIRRIAVGG